MISLYNTLRFFIFFACLSLATVASAATRTASSSGNWNSGGVGGTWTGAAAPVAGDAVIIPLGITVTISANAACASITNAGTLTFGGAFTLTVTGNIVNNNTINPGSGTVTFAGNTTISGTPLLPLSILGSGVTSLNNIIISGTLTAAPVLQIDGDFTNNGTFNNSTGTVIMDGVTNTYGTSTTVFNNIIVTNGSTFRPAVLPLTMTIVGNITNNGTWASNNNTITFNGNTSVMGSAITVFNNVIINATKTFTAHPTTSTQFKGNFQNDGSFVHSSSSVIFVGTSTISGASTTTFYNLQVYLASTLTAPAGTIIVEGNWTNRGTFNPSTGTVRMQGSVAQTIGSTASTTFYNLIINNSSTGVTLTMPPTVTNVLTLTAGALKLNQKTITITNASNAAITRTSGYIVSEDNSLDGASKANNLGKVQWNIGASLGTYTIPFGTTGGTYIPLVFTTTAGTFGNVTAATYSTAINNTPYTSAVSNVGNYTYTGIDNSANTADRFWELSNSGAGGVANLSFTYADAEIPVPGELGSDNQGMRAQYWSTNRWTQPLPVQTFTAATNTVTVSTTSNLGSTWALALKVSPLPVDLLYFKANKSDNNIELKWATASETNNDYFTVERSSDGIQFYSIGLVKGQGTKTQQSTYNYRDLTPVSSATYYRLKQTDFNGDFKTFSPVFITGQIKTKAFQLLNNLSASPLLMIPASDVKESINVDVFDNNGRIVYSTVLPLQKEEASLPLAGFGGGMYIVRVFGTNLAFTERMIITD